jgi:hypothetical protein
MRCPGWPQLATYAIGEPCNKKRASRRADPVRHGRTVRRSGRSHQPGTTPWVSCRGGVTSHAAAAALVRRPAPRQLCATRRPAPRQLCARPAAGAATTVQRQIDGCRATGISAGLATTIAPRGPTLVAPPVYSLATLQAPRSESTGVALPPPAARRPPPANPPPANPPPASRHPPTRRRLPRPRHRASGPALTHPDARNRSLDCALLHDFLRARACCRSPQSRFCGGVTGKNRVLLVAVLLVP